MNNSEEPTIKLEQFLKFHGIAETGGHAKVMVQAGEVLVNGEVETRRGKRLRHGDRVEVMGETFEVEFGEVED